MIHKSNPNYRKRTLMADNIVRLDPRLMTEGDIKVLEINSEHGELEAGAAQRLSRRHIEEVRRYMPYIHDCREKKKLIRRVPRDVLETVRELCLV